MKPPSLTFHETAKELLRNTLGIENGIEIGIELELGI